MVKKSGLGISLDQTLLDEIDKLQKDLGFYNGALIFKRSPMVCALIKIGLKHKDEIKNNGELK